VADDVSDSDAMDDALRAKVNESWERYSLDRTPENHVTFERAVKAFADWVLRRRLPEAD
jgi:hypothetical protein